MAEAVIECPYCGAETAITGASAWCTCSQCGRRSNIEAQSAFRRGLESFEAGQDAWAAALDRTRRPRNEPEVQEALFHYGRAHSSLWEAFRFELADRQREHAVEMMAEISRLFSQHNMVSSLEGSYWGRVTLEQNTLRELDQLEEKLADPAHKGVPHLPQRLHWLVRTFQLRRALRRLDGQLETLEETIAFVDPPHARRPRR